MERPLRLRTLTPLLVLCISSWACKSSQSSTEAPYAFATGVGHAPVDSGTQPSGVPVPAVQLAANLSATPASVAAEETEGVLAMSVIAALASTLTARGHALDVTKTPEAVTAAIAAAIPGSSCPSMNMAYQLGTAYLTLDLGGGCAMTGSSVVTSGKILVGVTGSSTGSPWSAVAFTFSSVAIDGRATDGYVSMSTGGDGYTFISRLTLADLGTIYFNGALTADASSASLDGAGTWTSNAGWPDVASADGWACAAGGSSSFEIHNMHTASSSCIADGGSVSIVRPYACKKNPDAGAAAQSVSFLSLSSVAFLPTTATAGNVGVTLTGPHAAMDGGSSVTVPLPHSICAPKGQ